MALTRFILQFVAPMTLAAGCLPLSQSADFFGATGGASDGTGGDGAANNATIKTNTETGVGGEGASSYIPPLFNYLCGGSAASCVPGPSSDECAPGGNPSMGASIADGGSKLTCQLVANEGSVEAKCTMAGTAGDGEPCTQATDCGVGLGCFASPVTSVCRQYCCGDPESCPEHTYCTPSRMAELDADVPFCVNAKTCDLLNDETCDAGETCTIVRNDGTTSCIPETPADKAGHEGDACPCANGYMCSNTLGTCVKLCHIGSSECGPNAICQGGTKPYPSTIGLCVPL